MTPTLGFFALSFFTSLLTAFLLGVSLTVALLLLRTDSTEQKRDEILIMGGIFTVVYWVVSLFGFLNFINGVMGTAGVVWIGYKWMDMPLLRSLVMFAVYVLCSVVLMTLVSLIWPTYSVLPW